MGGEQCDDGNLMAGDGCSGCAVETQERLEVTIEEQRVQMDALQGELKTLHSANSQAAEMARYVCILGARL